nr:hypothetical protein [Solirubrobacterales bacterium]
VLRELLAERTGYELHLDALVTAQHPPQRVTADVLLQARDPAKRDVLVNVRVPVRAETSTAGLTSDRAIGATARYEAMTARKALAWVVVVLPDGSDTLPLEERLTTLLAGHGTATVLERSQLPALRRIPTPGATG